MQTRREFLQISSIGAAIGTLPGLLRAASPTTSSPQGTSSIYPASTVGGTIPVAYRQWQERARGLIEPLHRLMQPGKAGIAIAGRASGNGLLSDRLESFARPLLLSSFYLQSVPEDDPVSGPRLAAFREDLALRFREGLLAGSDPKSPEYFGPDGNYAQQHVEMGLVAIALQMAASDLWDPLSQGQKHQVAQWLESLRGNGCVDNNHYFMAIHVLEFLHQRGYGRGSDLIVADEFLDRLDAMHRGGGWFQDGINQTFDHYNAYAFHFYGLWWSRLYGQRDPARARLFRDRARSFVADYEHFFAASGEHPAFGRSITYRFNAINVFGMALAEGCCDLPPGRLRRLCTRNIDFFLSRPIRQSQGCLSMGWLDTFEPITESYSCAASPYWAAKGLAPLLVPPSHPFWSDPEIPLLSESTDYARVIRPAGLVVRSTGGEVEILNAGSQISHFNVRYGTWKWSKTAYRTGTGFTVVVPAEAHWSADNAVTMQLGDGRVFGRHATVALRMDENHLSYSWTLGPMAEGVSTAMETTLWWKAGWILQLHRFDPRQPCVLRVGGYSTAHKDPAAFTLENEGSVMSAWAGGKGSVLQGIVGVSGSQWDRRLDESTARIHLMAPYHATPMMVTGQVDRPGCLAVLAWAGSDRAEAQSWKILSGTATNWTLSHPTLGSWHLSHEDLPGLV